MNSKAYFRYTTGSTLYANLIKDTTDGDVSSVVSVSEHGSTGLYSASLPEGEWEIFLQAGGSPATSDTAVGSVDIEPSTTLPAGQRFQFNFENVATYIQIPVLDNFSRLEDWTFSTWCAQRSTPDNDLQTLVEHSKASGNRLAIRLATGSNGGCIEVAMYNGSSYTRWQTDYKGFNDNRRHFVVVVWDGSSQAPEAIYVDGYSVPFTSDSSNGGISATAQYIGYKSQATAYASRHRQADTCIFTRKIAELEVLQMWEDRLGVFRENDAHYRLHPQKISTTAIPNIGTGTDADASFVGYDREIYEPVVDEIDPLFSVYAIGNSLTEDASSGAILAHGSQCINSGETLAYHYANPGSYETGSIPWNVALATREYDLLAVQPYQDDPLQTLEDDLVPIRAWMDMQPKAIILIDSAFPVASEWDGGATPVDDTYTGNFAYSAAYFDAMVEQLRLEYPERKIYRTKTLECVELAVSRIQAETSALATVNGTVNQNDALYRDGIHLNRNHGRYLASNSRRRALDLINTSQLECVRGFISYDGFDGIQPDFQDEMDFVLDEIYGPEVDTNLPKLVTDETNEIDTAQQALSSAVATVDANVDSVLALVTAGATIQSPVPSATEIELIAGDTYDGSSSPKLSWTVTKDYSGNTIKLVIHNSDASTIYGRFDGAVDSSTAVSVTMDATFDTEPTYTPCNTKVAVANIFFSLVSIDGGSDEETIARGTCKVYKRGSTA